MDYIVKPWKHQENAVNQSFLKSDLALLWDVGVGKSGAAINILRGRYGSYGRIMRTIVLSPPIVLRNWKDEFALHSKVSGQAEIIRGTGAKRVSQLRKSTESGKIILLNYEALLNKEIMEILLAWKSEIVICDEAHRCKNFKSKRAQAVYLIAKDALHRYILTGTPVLNSAQDLFMQFKILDGGHTFGTNFYAFQAMYFQDQNVRWKGKQGYFPKWVPRPEAYAEFAKRIAHKSIICKKEDCLDLPPYIEATRDVEMSQEQQRMYIQMRDDYITWVKTQEGKPPAVVAQLAITKALRLQQIVSGFAKDDSGEIHPIKDLPRLSVLRELVEEITGQGHKVIVWCVFKENRRQITEMLADAKIEYAELHGDIDQREKEAQIKRFRTNPSCKVMIGTQSVGIGINLTEASYSIFYSKGFSLGDDLQAEGRNYRGGSDIHEKITRIDLVTRNTIDELVLDALKTKQNISDRILRWTDKLGGKHGNRDKGGDATNCDNRS